MDPQQVTILQSLVKESFQKGLLIKGYFEVIRAIEYKQHIDKIYTTNVDNIHLKALQKALDTNGLTCPVVNIEEMPDSINLVYKQIIQVEKDRDKVRKPFKTRVFAILNDESKN